ncbi:MAG: hypothetical protein K1W30_11885 [Lachnospiraceae bacterium]
METYQEFLDRIYSFEKKEIHYGDSYFHGNPSISLKVNKDNSFQNFYGDTIVFALADAVKEALSRIVETLYQSAPECFCERLVPDTFHVTLHDLGNSPVLRDVAEEVFENELNVIRQKQTGAIQKLANTSIRLKSTYLFNMVDTSLVLGLFPADEDTYHRLMGLYSMFDSVKKLNYPFTPHITLAYYNVNGFDSHAARILENTVNELNQKIDIELNVHSLYYQKFKSMNEYIDVICLGAVGK